MNKQAIKRLIPYSIWRSLRTKHILRDHKECAEICEELINDYYHNGIIIKPTPKKSFTTNKIVWQYWAQGFDNLPPTVKECLKSVEVFAKDYTIIRLSDDNLNDYLDIPKYISNKRNIYSVAFFSDLLRVMLLSCYGGVWLDATVMLSGSIPEDYFNYDFFLFQRDPNEPNKAYWKNVYAYYYSWDMGFRVNMLSSIFFAHKDTAVINALSSLMMKWWKENESLPDYFFLQILFDVLINGRMKGYNCPIISDCKPHYLQQSINDPNFDLMDRDTILATIPIHKLTYKKEN